MSSGPRRPALRLHSHPSLAWCPCIDSPSQLGSDSHPVAFLTPRLPHNSEALVLAGSVSLGSSGLMTSLSFEKNCGVKSLGSDIPRLLSHRVTSPVHTWLGSSHPKPRTLRSSYLEKGTGTCVPLVFGSSQSPVRGHCYPGVPSRVIA